MRTKEKLLLEAKLRDQELVGNTSQKEDPSL
jgi:hypothetical protein